MKHIKFFIAAVLLVFVFDNSKANNLSGSVKPLVLQVRTPPPPPAPPTPPRISFRHHRYGHRHHRSLNLHVHLPPPPPAPPRP